MFSSKSSVFFVSDQCFQREDGGDEGFVVFDRTGFRHFLFPLELWSGALVCQMGRSDLVTVSCKCMLRVTRLSICIVLSVSRGVRTGGKRGMLISWLDDLPEFNVSGQVTGLRFMA